MQSQDDLKESINSEDDYREIQILLTKILIRAAPQFGCCIFRRLMSLSEFHKGYLVTNRIGQTYRFSVLRNLIKYFSLLQALEVLSLMLLNKTTKSCVLIF